MLTIEVSKVCCQELLPDSFGCSARFHIGRKGTPHVKWGATVYFQCLGIIGLPGIDRIFLMWEVSPDVDQKCAVRSYLLTALEMTCRARALALSVNGYPLSAVRAPALTEKGSLLPNHSTGP